MYQSRAWKFDFSNCGSVQQGCVCLLGNAMEGSLWIREGPTQHEGVEVHEAVNAHPQMLILPRRQTPPTP